MLGVSQNLGIWFLRPEWEDAIALGILLLFLLARPAGIFGRRVYKVEI
jgi:branched-subunit amino acid ABC-type transport system permease component